jgi:hypothetical protein
MPNMLSSPGYRIETYVKELHPNTAHYINADFERKEMSELYKTIHFLVRQKPEYK